MILRMVNRETGEACEIVHADLLACPFCGETGCEVISSSCFSVAVQCPSCLTSGPIRDIEHETEHGFAISQAAAVEYCAKKWNDRKVLSYTMTLAAIPSGLLGHCAEAL